MSLKPKVIDFEETWVKIKKTMNSVIMQGETSNSQNMKEKRDDWNDRFHDIYALCVACPEPFTHELYDNTSNYLREHVGYLYKSVISGSPDLLKDYIASWNQFNRGSNYINSLYGYLNKLHCSKSKNDSSDRPASIFPQIQMENVLEIGHLALDIWKEHLIKKINDSLVKAIIDSIRRDRDGESSTEADIHQIIHSFIDVERYETKTPLLLYQSKFEAPLLAETSEYYQKEAARLLETCNCSQYMQKVDARLKEEEFRTCKYLHATSVEKVMSVCQDKLVKSQLHLLQSECHDMIHNEKLTDLSRMYKLLKPLPKGLDIILSEFEKYIANTGLAKVKAFYTENGTGQFVDTLLEIHKKYTEIIEKTFTNDQQFLGARDKACTKIVNYRIGSKKQCKSPEMLAKYCDSLLKKSTKHLSELEIDARLNNVIIIFKYIDDKDVFQKFYSKLLAKRLVHSMSVSMDSEESMINRLKLACGYEYTSKLHRMFTDIKVSEDLNSKFFVRLDGMQADVGISFSLLVLQSGAWPLNQTAVSDLQMPSELAKSIEMFEAFYNELYSGRKLTWLTHLSNGEIKMNVQKKTYIITVTTYQMIILLLFNDGDNLSYTDIENQARIVDKELSRTLQSLVDVKILNKTPKEATTLSNCVFTLNNEFTNKRTKFKITTAVQKESAQETEQTHAAVDEDRRMYIQATIVRIMKHNKVFKHHSLMEEVVKQVSSRFLPNVVMIKKCIETLIDKQYIERSEGSKDEYTYLA